MSRWPAAARPDIQADQYTRPELVRAPCLARTEGGARCLLPASKKLHHRDGLTCRACDSSCCTQIDIDIEAIPAANQCGWKGLSLGGNTQKVVQVKATKDGKTWQLGQSEPVEATEDAKRDQVRLSQYTHDKHDLSFIPTRLSAHNAFSRYTLATPHLAIHTTHET